MPIVRELITLLGFKVDEGKIRRAERLVDNYRRQAMGAARASNAAGASVGSFTRRLVGLTSAALGVRAVIGELAEYERLQGILITLEGSTEAARRQFEFLNEFARTTPFNIDQVTKAYLRLTAVGIRPTREMLSGLGNIAAAMGEDIERIVEGTVQLQAGLTRQLKNVLKANIHLRNQGRTALFEIRGQTYEMENRTEVILDFLQRIGEAEFAGGMAMQMERLPGLFSNSVDAIKRFVREFGEGGFIMALREFLEVFIETTEEGQSMARMLGDLAGRALKALTDALKFAKEHAVLFKSALTALFVAGTGNLALRFFGFISNFFRLTGGGTTLRLVSETVTRGGSGGAGSGLGTGIGAGTGMALGGMLSRLLPWLARGTAVLGVGLLIEDLYTGLSSTRRGADVDSLIDSLMQSWSEQDGGPGSAVGHALGQFYVMFRDYNWEDFAETTIGIMQGAVNLWDRVFGNFNAFFDQQMEGAQAILERLGIGGVVGELAGLTPKEAAGRAQMEGLLGGPQLAGPGVTWQETYQAVLSGETLRHAIGRLRTKQRQEESAYDKALGPEVATRQIITQDVVLKFENNVTFTGDPEANQTRREMMNEMAEQAILPEVERMLDFVHGTGGLGGD